MSDQMINPSFNLWRDPWLTLEDSGGELKRMGLEAALLQAHALRGLYECSPLAVVGAHRLLTAVLQDALNPQETADLRAIWDAAPRQFPRQPILDFGKQYAHRFDLFGEAQPFLQSGDLPLRPEKGSDVKTVAYLAPELPSGTAITHYHHAVESEHVFCPTCAALGLVMIPAFATSGGAGIKPSINGVPPLYVIPGGETLFESLASSLILPTTQPSARSNVDYPWWKRPALVKRGQEVNSVGYLESFTFPARRVRLHPQEVRAVCTRCGAYTHWGVRTMIFEMGESRPKEAAFWQDPFAAYNVDSTKKQPIPIRPSQGKAAWREFGGLFLRAPYNSVAKRSSTRPRVVDQIEMLAENDIGERRPALFFRCVGLRTDMKAKIFEWVDTGFDVPVSLIDSDQAWSEMEPLLKFSSDCAAIMASAFREAVGREERRSRVRSEMIAAFWQRLAEPFRLFVLGLAAAVQEGADDIAPVRGFAEAVTLTARQVFEEAMDSLGDDAKSLSQAARGKQRCGFNLWQRAEKEKKRYERSED